jgi:hypothetical protein
VQLITPSPPTPNLVYPTAESPIAKPAPPAPHAALVLIPIFWRAVPLIVFSHVMWASMLIPTHSASPVLQSATANPALLALKIKLFVCSVSLFITYLGLDSVYYAVLFFPIASYALPPPVASPARMGTHFNQIELAFRPLVVQSIIAFFVHQMILKLAVSAMLDSCYRQTKKHVHRPVVPAPSISTSLP